MPEAPPTAPETVSGIIERVTFHNEETGFCVLRVKPAGRRARTKDGLLTVVGSSPTANPGEYIVAEGAWVRDREHGLQLKAGLIRCTPPTSLEGMEKYLGSGLIKGIGPHFAKKLMDHFGERILDIIDKESAKLEQVEGIGSGRRARIKAAWDQQKVVRDIMVFLHSHGMSTSRAVRIYKLYGEKAIEILRANPYRLAHDVPGIGFLTADKIAQKLGIPANSVMRAAAAIEHHLQEAAGDGHCALPEDLLRSQTLELLGSHGGTAEPAVLDQALRRMLDAGEIIRETVDGTPLLFVPALRNAEIAIADAVRRLAGAAPNLPAIDVPKALAWVEEKTGKQLAPQQQEAVTQALARRILVVTGGPGVGKTTIVNSILQILRAKKVRCVLAAPTGRAARRLAETTSLPASTIHRLLEASPGGGFKHHPGQPLEGDYFVVDETSMVDAPLMAAFLRALPPPASVLLVGDADQLPSVGPGLVLQQLIASGVVPVVRLTQIFRQAAASRIVTSAHSVNEGRIPDLEANDPATSDFFFIERDDPEKLVRTLIELARDRIPPRLQCDPVGDIAILAPMHRGNLGCGELNHALQAALNPARPGEPVVRRFAWEYRLRDKVLQTRNNYDKDVFNGDIGRITRIEPDDQLVFARFDNREVEYEFHELDELVPAYAMTIHKSQGSEFPAVILPLATQHFVLLQRNLLYTGITRGKRLVVLIGSKRAIGMAIRNQETRRRHTGLLWRLQR